MEQFQCEKWSWLPCYLPTYAPPSTALAHNFIFFLSFWKSFIHLQCRILCDPFFILEFYFIFHFDAKKRRSFSRYVCLSVSLRLYACIAHGHSM